MPADIGSKIHVGAAPGAQRPNNELHELVGIRAFDFEVVKFNN